VGELRAAAGGALAEVVLLEQEHRVAARGGVERDPRAGRAAADHHHVPRFAPRRRAAEHLVAVHAPSYSPMHSTRFGLTRNAGRG
jgi:hypothetical protein